MGGTCYAMGLMLAYNQFSGNSALLNYNTATYPAFSPTTPAAAAAKGAQKIVIFETDGAPNTTASANFVNGGAYNSYYKVRYNQNNKSASEYPYNVNGYSDNDPTVVNQAVAIVTQMTAPSRPMVQSRPAAVAALHCLRSADHRGRHHDAQQHADGRQCHRRHAKLQDHPECQHLCDGPATGLCQILQDGVQVSLIQ